MGFGGKLGNSDSPRAGRTPVAALPQNATQILAKSPLAVCSFARSLDRPIGTCLPLVRSFGRGFRPQVV